MEEYKLRISTFEERSEMSFFGAGISIKASTELDFAQLSDVARLYYGSESEESESLWKKIESEALSTNSVKHHDAIYSLMFKALGEYVFQKLLPPEIAKAVQRLPKNSTLFLDLNTGASLIPWEYMHTGENFICLDHVMGRFGGIKHQVEPTRRRGNFIPMLIVADPTGDLYATQLEINYIIGQLRGSNIRITRYGSEIRKKNYIDLLKSGKFEIVHYSGHSASSVEPGKSHHVFLDGNLYGSEIVSLSSKMMPQLVFSNSCQSGESSFSKEITGNTSLASSYLKAGARGCIGTIWPVSDIGAGDFASNVYRYLLFGSTIGEAMLRSKRSSFKRWGYQDLVWASFLLFGDPSMRLVNRN